MFLMNTTTKALLPGSRLGTSLPRGTVDGVNAAYASHRDYVSLLHVTSFLRPIRGTACFELHHVQSALGSRRGGAITRKAGFSFCCQSAVRTGIRTTDPLFPYTTDGRSLHGTTHVSFKPSWSNQGGGTSLVKPIAKRTPGTKRACTLIILLLFRNTMCLCAGTIFIKVVTAGNKLD